MRWADVRDALETMPRGEVVVVPRGGIAHPRAEGAARSLGWPRGQIADWRFPPTVLCRGLHVHEYADRWVAHLDRVHPRCDPIEHLRHDAPAVLVSGAALVGGLVGVLVGRGRRGLATGFVTGAALGLALVQSARVS